MLSHKPRHKETSQKQHYGQMAGRMGPTNGAYPVLGEKTFNIDRKYFQKLSQTIEEFPIIGFYLYHVTSAGQSSNWTTSGI